MASVGIDFGTSYTCMAWFNPKTKQAEVIKNAQGEEKTPSLVYFGEDGILVGSPVENLLNTVQNLYYSDRQKLLGYIIVSIKRNLISPPSIFLPNGKWIKPRDVVFHILSKLKRDAEEYHFGDEVDKAVLTCPYSFDPLQRDILLEAAEQTGFREVVLLDEPVAAGLAYVEMGQKVGNGVLVYDLGGGTFDLAFMLRDKTGEFRLAIEPYGDSRCGGNDFDQLLYTYFDEESRESLDCAISPGEVDKFFLKQCKTIKETLTSIPTTLLATCLFNGKLLRKEVKRTVFEDLIKAKIDKTIRKTVMMFKEVKEIPHPGNNGKGADTLVLVGGASRIPIIEEKLKAELHITPLKFMQQDLAVCLGAAYKAEQLWPSLKK